LRVSVAQVADYDVFLLRVHVRDPAWASVDALAASSALLVVHQNRTGFLADRESVNWARFDTGIIFTLSAEVWKLQAWNEHEDPDHGCLRPNAVFMEK
jgi:hypothetical protein